LNKTVVLTVKEEAAQIFAQGAEATGEYLKESYKSYQKLNTEWKKDEDNVVLQLEVNKAKVLYNDKKTAINEAQVESDELNPEIAEKRVALEKAKKEEIRKAAEEKEKLPESDEADALTELNLANDEGDEEERQKKVAEVINK
jgi:hypothetical protein